LKEKPRHPEKRLNIRVGAKGNTTIEAVVLRKLSDFVEQDLKREAALGQLEDFIERLNGCDRTKYVGWSD